MFSSSHNYITRAFDIELKGTLLLFTDLFFTFFLNMTDNSFDWIVITSPEAGSVFLDAWR